MSVDAVATVLILVAVAFNLYMVGDVLFDYLQGVISGRVAWFFGVLHAAIVTWGLWALISG